MNAPAKNKLLTWLVILLLIANAATLTMFWLGKRKPPPPKGTPQEFLVRELKLDAKQQEQLGILIKEHREAAEKFREKVKEAKDSFFNLLQQPAVPDSIKRTAAAAVSAVTEQLDLLTLDHFQKIRSLCTPDQQKIFDHIIHEVTRMMAPSQPGGPGRGPQGPPDGPPPGGPDGERPPPPH